jgi:hypothetical protein
MNSSVHFGKNEGSPSFVGARGRLDSQAEESIPVIIFELQDRVNLESTLEL